MLDPAQQTRLAGQYAQTAVNCASAAVETSVAVMSSTVNLWTAMLGGAAAASRTGSETPRHLRGASSTRPATRSARPPSLPEMPLPWSWFTAPSRAAWAPPSPAQMMSSPFTASPMMPWAAMLSSPLMSSPMMARPMMPPMMAMAMMPWAALLDRRSLFVQFGAWPLAGTLQSMGVPRGAAMPLAEMQLAGMEAAGQAAAAMQDAFSSYRSDGGHAVAQIIPFPKPVARSREIPPMLLATPWLWPWLR